MILFSSIIYILLLSPPTIANILTTDARRFQEDEKNTIAVYEQTIPSIVHVAVVRKMKKFQKFSWRSSRVQAVPRGIGSGFLWDNQGHIVTNHHVTAGENDFFISFKNDKTQYRALLVGSEPKKDISVLKIVKTASKFFRPLKKGDSHNLQIGQKALAIGNPFGLDHSLTAGVISALERKTAGLDGVTLQGMIQTDSSIHPGNSGGPLIDSRGEVIGMNTLIFSTSNHSQGVGFAIPINTIKRIVPQLIKYGTISRAGLGLTVSSDYLKKRFGIENGLIIEHIAPNSPAYKSGLRGISQDYSGRWFLGDILCAIDDVKINSYDEIYHILDRHQVGDHVKITYRRDQKYKKVKIKLIKII